MTRITLGYLAKYCIFVFLIILMPKFSSANNYVFTVHTTKACPRNKSEMDERSRALNCTESNGYVYTCLPDKNLNVLLEFCYKRARIPVTKGLTYSDLYIIEINAGYCLFLRYSDVDAYDCKLFMNGCPDADYYSDEIFKYPNCVAIGSGCFLVDASCNRIPAADTKTVTTNSKDFTKNTNLDYQLWISTLAVLLPIGTVMCIVIVYAMHQQKKSQLQRYMMSPCEINTAERDIIAYSSDYSSKKENHSTDEISSIHTNSDSSSFLNASSPLYDSFEQGPYSGVALSLDDNACLQQPDESERSLFDIKEDCNLCIDSGFSPLVNSSMNWHDTASLKQTYRHTPAKKIPIQSISHCRL